ncbi:surfactin synthase thioesterase subunit [Advenella incenata]|uniref:Surfactin synthase thioesterase subunit n=1 Tax=Advenella incenata TaxID=267800 RepID=A0A4Q7VRA4_9BURK|nr:thioesterase domain-containing protein [Advenella incenata]RZT99030.1 surfactin synthase thioesterase subunit [Advenella incenata]
MNAIDFKKWFVCRNGNERPYQLYMFPYAGGNVASFMNWQKDIAKQFDLIGVQLPGRGSHYSAAFSDDIQILVREMVPLFAGASKPFAFFGHSLGGLLSFLVCRQLYIEGHQVPNCLIISGCKAPEKFSSNTKEELTDAALIAMLREYGGTPEQVLKDNDMMELFIPTIKADLSLVDSFSYQRSEKINVPILVLSGVDDEAHDYSKAFEWVTETIATVEFNEFPGGHFFINNNKDEMFSIINAYLNKHFLP